MHEKNDFAEVSKNLDRYKSENNFVGLSKNNYVGNSSMMRNATKYFVVNF